MPEMCRGTEYPCTDAGVLTLFEDRIAAAGSRGASKDPKTRLQELLQGRALALPLYEVVGQSGSEHARTFTVRCVVPALALETTGSGSSRRAAEKAAAEKMLEAVEGT